MTASDLLSLRIVSVSRRTNVSVNCELSLDKNFDLVKPEKSAFESAIAAEMVPILKTDPSRLEFVGTERWKPPRPTVDDKGDASITAKGTLVHINILPPLPTSSDKRSVADLQAELQATVDDPGKDNAMYASKPLQGLSKIEWQFHTVVCACLTTQKLNDLENELLEMSKRPF